MTQINYSDPDHNLLRQKDITFKKGITLEHNQSTFYIDYTSLSYQAPNLTQYAYCMEGLSSKWYHVVGENRVYFTKLPPGNYTFKVKAANLSGIWNDEAWAADMIRKYGGGLSGIWNDEPAMFQITILPPWWLSTKALILYGIIAIGCVVLLIFIISRHNKANIQQKIQEFENEKEKELYQAKIDFFINIAHEIRTPLNAIVGFSNLLPSAETLEEEKLYSSIINQNSEILLQLINDILDLSKIEAGTLEYVRQPMNLGEVCRNIYQIHKDRVQEGVTLILDNEDDDLIIEEDRNRIAQVITNFLTNAGKFTLSGEIRFGFKVDNQCIRFYVKDTGIGIAPDKVGHIFDRFVKLNSFAQGTGLGLAICRMIIEKIGGEIGATSEVGKGSTFFFTIPYKEHSDDRIAFSEVSETKYISHTIKRVQKIKKILVAEDVDSNFVLIKNMIGKDYTLLWAKDGFEAVEMYKQFQPDLILMDIKMPRMGGLEATRIIRSYSKEIPVIALTAYAFEADKEQALEAGCNDFVTKPVSKAALEEALGKCSG